MQLTPKNVFKVKNADGSKSTVEEWEFGTIAGLEIAQIFAVLIASILIGSVISPILLVLSILSFNGRRALPHILGLLISLYFMFDCYNGWIGVHVLSLCLSEFSINVIIALNGAAMLAHAVLLIFGVPIYKFVTDLKDEGKQPMRLLEIVAVVLTIGFMISFNITSNHRGWLEHNVKYEPTEQYVPHDEHKSAPEEKNEFAD